MLVETAIVLPILVVLVLGTLEFGYLYMHASSMANASAVGARAGGATKFDAVPDSVILDQVKSRKLALENASHVIIYKSQTADGKAPAACLAGSSVAGLCNVYPVNQEGKLTGSENAWPASSRVPGTDYLGVAIQGKHTWLTGVFGGGVDLRDAGVVLLEPAVSDLGTSETPVMTSEGPKWGTKTPGIYTPTDPATYDAWFMDASPYTITDDLKGTPPNSGGGTNT